MQVILTYLGTMLGSVFADKILQWIAIKAILVFLFITVVPLLLNNFLYDMIEIMMNFAGSQAGDASNFSGAMTFTGFMGWVLDCFQIPQALSVIVSALCLRLALSMIPFVRLVG